VQGKRQDLTPPVPIFNSAGMAGQGIKEGFLMNSTII